ncbi:3-deoxy-D-manno-octulosonic acid transferase [Aquabacterium sp. NJ1]|uniref:3-deoxy-D-manno-octulosonic acid transferase n=1 Tax=Aquabacterium sp. NJ1 TaxID=1538295 RepID=UPI00052C5A1D|nr:3-deoxy-D-manno-octulosonic acid transferase [Aquabacterium sp. NJ1]KGM41340.1 3-deoxy-D-manno-octulosonic acid transferase [Aquabacterium sp. NJ1]
MTALALKPWLARQAYSLLLRLGTPAYLWRIWSRGKVEPGYREAWPQRLGIYDAAYRQAWQKDMGSPARPVVWVHAVSLGEARAAAPLIQALRQQRPGMRLLLTHGTATGREAGRALLQPGDVQTWFPFDTPGAVRRFLAMHQPSVGVLMETEVWPNVQHVARCMGVPMVLANARLSEKSLKQGQRLAALMRPAAQNLTVALAQTPDDARRLKAMGAQDVRVSGNVKFDMSPAPDLLARGQAWSKASVRPIVLAASTREGEEPGLLDAWMALRRSPAWPQLGDAPRLLIVPRHPQRFDEVAALITQTGMSLSRRSGWPDGQPDAAAKVAEVWLGDSMGEMPAYYAAAHVALLGGSFAPLGGQNLIEAAACGCPVIMGPHTFNFADASDLSEAAGAAYRVPDVMGAVMKSVSFCNDETRFDMAQKANDFARQHRGAAQGMAALIWGFLPPHVRGNV